MSLRIFIPRDAGAIAVGADEAALALEQAAGKRGIDIEIVRTGSRGLYWLEPIYCLGLCATAPSAMLDGRLIGRLDEARIDALVAEAQR